MKRSRGEGRLFRPSYTTATGERKRTATWWIQYHRNGSKVRESSKSERKQDAARLLRDRLAALAAGRPTGPVVERTTYDDMAKILEDSFVVNGRRSLKRLKGALVHLAGEFRGVPARAIDEGRIGAYTRKRLDEGAANGTINRELTALKRMYNLAIRAQRVARRPHIEMLAEATPRSGFVERQQYEAILAKLPTAVQPVVATAYLTGWRLASEILTRQWRHVDLNAGFLRLEPGETKNGQGRMFPLIPELRAVLEAQRKHTTDVEQATGQVVPWVFHRNGKPLASLRKGWDRACTEAGFPALIPHDLRRSAVRNLERAGVPRSTAMAMVGHKTESIYRRYAIVDETMLREGAEKLATYHDNAHADSITTGIVVPIGRKAAGKS
jgi:integrase